jgi:probable blue pigment (indigoidine) exporter
VRSVREYRFVVFLVGSAASWGVATAVSKRAVDEISPLVLLPIQLGVSVVSLGALMRVCGGRVVWSPGLRRLGALGVLNPGISYALGLLGLSRITASMSVLLWAVEPVLILLLARWVLRERMPAVAQLGVLVALGGVVLVVYRSGAAGGTTGVALTLAGVGACAAYSVACRRLLVDDSALPVVVVQQACALAFAVFLLTIAWMAGWAHPPTGVSVAGWVSAAASGVLYYGLAFWLYLNGLRRVTAGLAGVFLTLIPVFGVAASYVLLAERLSPAQWVGAVVVVVSVGAVALSHRQLAPAMPS